MKSKPYIFSTERIILIFIFIGCALSVTGQSYNPMLADSNSWYSTYWFEVCSTTKYQTTGDTVIHGIIYKKLQTLNYSGFSDVGYLREDTSLKRIYAKFASDYINPYPFDSALLAFDDTSEFLIYDFNLAAGDSIYIIAPELFVAGAYRNLSGVDTLGWNYVDSVSSIATLGGNRKAIYLRSHLHACTYCIYMTWIEGVGAINGPYLNYTFNYDYISNNFLSCFYKNNVHEYFRGYNDTATSCYCSALGIEQTSGRSTSLSISPNPSNDLVNVQISGGNNQLFSACIYDLSGRPLKTLFADQSVSSFQFDMQPFVSGVYFVKVTNQDGEQTVLRLLRQ